MFAHQCFVVNFSMKYIGVERHNCFKKRRNTIIKGHLITSLEYFQIWSTFDVSIICQFCLLTLSITKYCIFTRIYLSKCMDIIVILFISFLVYFLPKKLARALKVIMTAFLTKIISHNSNHFKKRITKEIP